MSAFDDNSFSIGRTPLVKINRIAEGKILLKLKAATQACR